MEEARAHYARGVQLYGAGSFGPALVELERAYTDAPSFRILYSMGLVQLKLGDLAGAAASFQQYLGDGGAEVPDARKLEVTGQLKELAAKIGTITLVVDVDAADVLVDDIRVGETPLAKPLLLNPGFHKVAVSKPGYDGEAKKLGVAAGDTTGVDLRLTPIAPVVVPVPVPVVVPPAPPPPAEVHEALQPTPIPSAVASRPVWIGWTATGALAGGATAFGIAALGESRKLTDDLNKPTPKSDIDAAHQSTTTLALVSDIFSGAAIVAGGVTLYFALTSRRSASTAELRVGPGSALVQGSF